MAPDARDVPAMGRAMRPDFGTSRESVRGGAPGPRSDGGAGALAHGVH